MTHPHADAPRQARILVVEDDAKTAELVALYLAHAGHSVSTERSGSQAIERLMSETFDLLLLDIMLPGANGLEIARRARERMATPIIFLSARTIEEDRLDGFAVGADDYVTKPFSPRELMARVEAVLRRSPPGGAPALRYADLVIDHERHLALLSGTALDLTPSEFTVLEALIAHPGFVRSRAWLLERLPGEGGRALDRIVDVHISNLRRKLATGALGVGYIETVVGVGYRVPVQPTAVVR
jgi:two-component system, OmpR family, alkaline phosphatase synthesis response regulator PhoP